MSDLNALNSTLAEIIAYDPSQLINHASSGQYKFDLIRPALERTRDLAAELQSLSFELLPEMTIDEIVETGKAVVQRYEQTWNFNIKERPSDTSPEQYAQGFMQAVKSNCDTFCAIVIRVQPFLTLHRPGSQALLRQGDTLFTAVQEKLSKVDLRIAELDNRLKVAQDTAARVGVSRHAESFKEASTEHEKASRIWLKATVGITITTIVAAVLFLYAFPAPGDLKDAAVIQRIILRIVALSIFYYGAIWSAKNYRTHRHLAVLNAHRQNALQTFESFVEGAGGDAQTKNAVLLEATRCIFTPANTGYLGAEDDNPSSRIIEIMKTVGGSAGK